MIKKEIGYIGTYTEGTSEGIYKFNINATTGEFSNFELAAKIDNPTYLTISSCKKKLYSVAKDTPINNITLGGVASFDINNDYTLSLTNKLTAPGKPPCHVNLIQDDKYLISTNYHDKHATIYSLDDKKNLVSTFSKAFHQGDAHIHFAVPTPENNYICILDLGRDEICLYRFNDGILKLEESLTIKCNPNSGPRHMVFSPCGNFAYVLCEISSEIITLEYLGLDGFKVKSYTSTLPNDFEGTNSTAAIRISNNGKYLYVSNRGHDSISAYTILNNGSIELINFYPTYGKEPRDFNLTPNENFLVIGNHKSDNITIYKRLSKGELELIQKDIYAPSPVCISFIK